MSRMLKQITCPNKSILYSRRCIDGSGSLEDGGCYLHNFRKGPKYEAVDNASDIDQSARRWRRKFGQWRRPVVRPSQKVKHSTAATRAAPPRMTAMIVETGRRLLVLEDCAIRVTLVALDAAALDELMGGAVV